MNNVQYFHGTKEKFLDNQFTVAVVVPTRENLRVDIWKLLGTNIKTISLSVGVTVVSPKDQYCKKTGRELSFSRIEEFPFQLVEVVATESGIVVELYTDGISLTFLMLENSDKVRLINAFI